MPGERQGCRGSNSRGGMEEVTDIQAFFSAHLRAQKRPHAWWSKGHGERESQQALFQKKERRSVTRLHPHLRLFVL